MKKIIFLVVILALPMIAKSQQLSKEFFWASSFLSLARYTANDQMVRRGPYDLPYYLHSDGSYLGGTGLSLASPPLSWAFSKFNSQADRKWGKELYTASIIFSLSRGGLTDAMIWSSDRDGVMADKTGWYYTTSLLAASLPTASMIYWSPSSKTEAVASTTAGILIGSVAWDMVFSELRYGDPFYPVPNWYGGWAPRSYKNFALARLSGAGAILLLGEIFEKKSTELPVDLQIAFSGNKINLVVSF